jgi:outer membrane protein
MLKRIVLTACVLGLLLGATVPYAAAADEGKWMVRLRALNIKPADTSDANGDLALAADAVSIDKATVPEVDFSYFFTPKLALELILATAKQDVSVTLDGTKTNIGSFRHIPPTLTLQYHFLPDGTFQPYVGAGLNYTIISSPDLNTDGRDLGGATWDISKHSFGWAVNAGFDLKIAEKWFVNLDIKKVKIKADVSTEGTKITTVHMDPLLIGVGVGVRF